MPAGDIALRWKWVERSVWTDRMLVALEAGVKGGKWYSLMDKVWTEGNLMSAWLAVAQNDGAAGIDRQSVAAFRAQRTEELQRLSQELRSERYQRRPARRVWIDKPGKPGQPAGERPRARPAQVRASVVAKKRCNITPWSQGTQESRCEYEPEQRKARANRHECQRQGRGYACRRHCASLEVGGTFGLDRSHVDGPGKRGQGKQMV